MHATYVAQDRLELLKNTDFGDALLSNGSHADGSATFSGVVYNRAYTVTGNPKLISYVVTWNDGVDHNVSFSTIRSQ